MAYVIATIHDENRVFGISFPDFPGCVSTAASLDEVLVRGAQALALHVEGMVDDGEQLPELRGLDQLRAAEPDWLSGATMVAMPVDLPAKAVRLNISLDANLLTRVDRAAKLSGQTRSGFIAHAVRQKIAANG